MKKNVLLVIGLSALLLSGCNSQVKSETEKTNVVETSDKTNISEESSSGSSTKESEISTKANKNSNKKAESIDIIAKGEYVVGTDIKPGMYYAVLTELTHGDDDPDKSAYVTMDVSGEKSDYETFYQVGTKKRFSLSDGDTVKFDDNYSPVSWTVRLLDDADFKKYTQDNK